MKNPLKIFISRDAMWGDELAVRIGAEARDGKIAVMQPAEFLVTEEPIETRPAFRFTRDDAQRFMDELWNVGIRPSEGTGSAGQLAATQAHLRDMQKLVFEVLKP